MKGLIYRKLQYKNLFRANLFITVSSLHFKMNVAFVKNINTRKHKGKKATFILTIAKRHSFKQKYNKKQKKHKHT